MRRVKSALFGMIIVLLAGCGVADTRAQPTALPATALHTALPATPAPTPAALGALPLEKLLFQPGDMPPKVTLNQTSADPTYHWNAGGLPAPARFISQWYGRVPDKGDYATTRLSLYPSAETAALAYATLLQFAGKTAANEIIPLDGMAADATLIITTDDFDALRLIATRCRATFEIFYHDARDREALLRYAGRLIERIAALDCQGLPDLPHQEALFVPPPPASPVAAPPPASIQPPVSGEFYQRPFIRLLHFVDADHGWITAGPDLLATTDGGQSWAVQHTGQISGLAFADQLHGWMLADDALFQTSDGGATWTARAMPAPINVLTILEQTSVVAVTGSGLFRLAMADDAADLLTDEPFRSVDFWNATSGWGYSKRVIGLGLAQTSDGGRSWTPIPTPTCTVGEPLRAAMVKLDQGYVLCADYPEGGPKSAPKELHRTDDGGRSWRLVANKNTLSLERHTGLIFDDELHGRQGDFVTADGGQTWTYAHPSVDIEDFDEGGQRLSPEVEFYIMNTYADRGYHQLHRTTDGGQSWEVIYRVAHDPPYAIEGIALWPDGTGLALRGIDTTGHITDTVFRTADQGRSWQMKAPFELPCPNGPAALPRLSWVDPPPPLLTWLTPDQGWALSQCAAPHPAVLFQTSDGGASWAPLDAAGIDQPLVSVTFVTPTSGYAVSQQGRLWRTGDGGASFQPIESGRPHGPVITFASPEAGWNIYDGQLLRTGDGGRTWSVVATPERALDVAVQGDGKLWAIVARTGQYDVSNQLLASADGGASWVAQDFGEEIEYRAVRFTDESHGWLLANIRYQPYSRLLYATSDGGASWVRTQ